MLTRSGVIWEPTSGSVEFVHKTLQEFLAAQHMMERDRVEALVERAIDPVWRETVVLACGCGVQAQRERLVRGLLSAAEQAEGAAQAELLAVTAASLESFRDIDRSLYDEVLRALRGLVPPTSSERALALAKAGEPVVEIIREAMQGGRYRRHYSSIEIDRMVDVLLATGGKEATRALTEFDADTLTRKLPDLVASWSAFDPRRFLSDVLGKLPAATKGEVRLADARLAPLTKELPAGIAVTLAVPVLSRRLCRLLSMSRLAGLEILDPGRGRESVRQFEFAASIDGLRRLEVHNLSQFEWGGGPPLAIEELRLSFVTGGLDLMLLSEWKGLRRLHIENAEDIAGVDELLMRCTKLRQLEVIGGSIASSRRTKAVRRRVATLDLIRLDGVRGLETLDVLEPARSVVRLELFNLPELTNIEVASGLAIEHLATRGCGHPIRGISQLAAIPNLQSVELDSADVVLAGGEMDQLLDAGAQVTVDGSEVFSDEAMDWFAHMADQRDEWG